MTIIQIGPYPLNDRIICGGVEGSVYGLAREQANDHTVVVMDMPRFDVVDEVEQKENMTVYRYRNFGKYNKDAVKRVEEIVGRVISFAPDICHIHGTGVFSLRMYQALKRERIPLMLTIHGLAKEEKRNLLKDHFSLKSLYQFLRQTKWERRLLETASRAIVDTQYVADRIGRYGLCSTPKLTVIPQGIEESFFDLSCSPDSRMNLSVGAYSRRKGHLLLIQAFEKLGQQIQNATLTLGGIVSDKEYFNELKQYVSASPLKNRISLLTNLPKDQLLLLYRQAQIFALHSQEESQGIVFAEAMAAGLPIVATNVGGIPSIVKDKKTGLLSTYGDINMFAFSLEKLLTSNQMWKTMSIAGKSASIYYSWKHITRDVEDAYDSIP